MNDYSIDDFGHALFTVEKKGIIIPVDCYGTIKAIEKKYILFEDNDNFPYLIEKAKFLIEKAKFQFERKEFKTICL
jgi:hypothetical protein